MRKKPAVLVLISLLTGTLSVLSSVRAQPSSDNVENTAFASALWQALVSSRLTGPGAMQSKPYPGSQPHGAVLQTFYTRLSVNGENNEVIVKRSYSGADVSEQAVANNPDKFLTTIAVMFKRPGYDPDNADWFWAEYRVDGSLSDDRNCIDCHATAGGGDFVFTR